MALMYPSRSIRFNISISATSWAVSGVLPPVFSDREVVHHAESLSARAGYGIALHPFADPVAGEYP